MVQGTKKKGLGKGLGALIPDADLLTRSGDQFFFCGIEEISPNPFQPRQNVRPFSFLKLAQNKILNGLINSLLLR